MRIFQDTSNRLPSIPLGLSSGGKRISMPYPEKEDDNGNRYPISDTVLIGGTPGSGKSVTGTLFAMAMSQRRPVYIIDPKGRDHYKNRYPNLTGKNCPPDMLRAGFNARYLYYGGGSRERMEYEEEIRPDFTKYNEMHYMHLGFSAGAGRWMKNIIEEFGPFLTMENFYEFIDNMPITDRQAQFYVKAHPIKIKHNKYYTMNSYIQKQSKESIKKVLPLILRMDVFNIDKSMDIDLMKSFKSGENLVFSFLDTKVGKIELDNILNSLEHYRDRYPNGNRPYIVVDEAQTIFADVENNILTEKLENFILTCRKLSVGLCLILPEVSNIGSTILSHIRSYVMFQYTGPSVKQIIMNINDPMAFEIPHLRFNKYTDERECYYFNKDFGQGFIIDKPYEAPCEVHKEVKA